MLYSRHLIAMLMSVTMVGCKVRDSDVYSMNSSDMKGYFEGVDTSARELEASRVLNSDFQGYSVEAFNRAGEPVQPHKNGNYNSVYKVRIEFADGVIAERVILNKDSLIFIYGE